MGLIQHALIKKDPVPLPAGHTKKKNGLLGRIVSLSAYDRLIRSFTDVLESSSCEKGLLLFLDAERYRVLYQLGFDITTCSRMMPELSFFDDFSSNRSWTVFSGDQLQIFSSFFSTRERNSLEELGFFPLNTGNHTVWLMLARSRLSIERGMMNRDVLDLDALQEVISGSVSLTSALLVRENPGMCPSTEKEKITAGFDERNHALLLLVSFEQIFPDSVQIETDYNDNVLYRAMANKIVRQAGPASIVRKADNYSLRILIFTASGTDPDLYIQQMKKTLEKHFGAARTARLVISYSGTSTNREYALAFLDGVY